jgi:hypothetical protein
MSMDFSFGAGDRYMTPRGVVLPADIGPPAGMELAYFE